MRNIAKKFALNLYDLMSASTRRETVNLVVRGMSNEDLDDIYAKIYFFLPSVKTINKLDKLTAGVLTNNSAILHDFGSTLPAWAKLHPGRFDIDRKSNPLEGWNWIDAANYVSRHQVDVKASKILYERVKSKLNEQFSGKPCHIFGTGPSLARAAEADWSDGIRIVCNTIVRDKELWRHINPHIIVAGDGIYHFGFTEFAREFRQDLKNRLTESPETVFIYPAQFDCIVRRELSECSSQLIPIPVGAHTKIHNNLSNNFALPALGNILNLLLLPIACDLSKSITLWGFDGRAPKDQLFWANSEKHSYSHLLPTLQEAHPAFFDHNVPKVDPEKYIRSVHGDVLERCLSQAEAEGWCFSMLHHTWTETLARRQSKVK